MVDRTEGLRLRLLHRSSVSGAQLREDGRIFGLIAGEHGNGSARPCQAEGDGAADPAVAAVTTATRPFKAKGEEGRDMLGWSGGEDRSMDRNKVRIRTQPAAEALKAGRGLWFFDPFNRGLSPSPKPRPPFQTPARRSKSSG